MLPYVYDAQAAEANIITAIDEMAQGRIDAIALTSSGQVRRLFDVARAHGCEARVARGAGADADRLGRAGGFRRTQVPRLAHRHLAGQRAFFMKPLISAMAAALGKDRAALHRHCEPTAPCIVPPE